MGFLDYPSIDASSTNTLKANPNRLAFFAYYRVFARVQ